MIKQIKVSIKNINIKHINIIIIIEIILLKNISINTDKSDDFLTFSPSILETLFLVGLRW